MIALQTKYTARAMQGDPRLSVAGTDNSPKQPSLRQGTVQNYLGLDRILPEFLTAGQPIKTGKTQQNEL